VVHHIELTRLTAILLCGSQEWLVVRGTASGVLWKFEGHEVVGLCGAGAVHIQCGVPVTVDDQELGVTELVAGGLCVPYRRLGS
jgi:hypothetical protein